MRFRLLAALMAAGVLSLAGGASAQAGPAWRIDSLSNTTALPGSTFRYGVEARNIGDAPTDGSPTTLTATLAGGITAVEADVLYNGSSIVPCTAENGVDPVLGESRVVCTTSDSLPVQGYAKLRLTVAVDPSASGTLVSEFGVSGGGGGSAGTVDPIRIGPPPGFGVDVFDMQTVAGATGTPFTQAGGHPYAITTSIDFNTINDPRPLRGDLWPVEPVKDLIVDLPPGLVGNPTGVPECPLSLLANSVGTGSRPLCPAASQIGTTVVRAYGPGISNVGPIPLFNLTPPPNVPARFGFNALGVMVVLDAQVRSGGDYGLSVVARNASEGLALAGTSVTFWGVPADSSHDRERACPGERSPDDGGPSCTSGAARRAFLRNPTSCPAPGVGLVTSLRVASWEHPGVFQETSFISHVPPGYPLPVADWGAPMGTTGCARVPFDPILAATPAPPAKVASPSGFSFDLTIPQTDEPAAIGQSDLKKAVVTLPEGVRVSPSSAHGLGACTQAEIQLNDGSAPSCPDSSRIGSVTIDTPLLEDPLTGAVHLAKPHDNPFGSLLAVYLVAEGPGVIVKLPGHVVADAATGQLTATFDDAPQLPFSRLHVEFNGGPGAPLVTPKKCGTYVTQAVLTGWSGKIVPSNSSFTVSQDGKGAPCPASQFSPGFTAGTENPIAGKPTSLHLSFSRGDDDEELKSVAVNMPNGLTGKIADVPLCAEGDAKTGSCSDASRVGRVSVGAGAGPNPFYIENGRAYLTGPYKGAPFGLSIVVPAVAGPFDLGNVNVRSSIFVDKHTAELRVVSDPLPTILQGIPLDVRDVRVSMDRDDFIVNPTSCAKKQIDGSIKSVDGKTAQVASRFQVSACANLKFSPKMAVSIGSRGHTSRGASVPFSTVVRMPSGGANLRFVRVTLPTTVNARLNVINRACTRSEYEAGRCASARAGMAVAKTPLLRDPLVGNVYFVRNGNPLPDLFIALRGQIGFDLIGKVTIPGSTQLRTTFDAVPDVPISSFTLNLVSGRQGPVGAATNLCSRRGRSAKAELDFIGQNGKVKQVDQRMKVRGCAAKRGHR